MIIDVLNQLFELEKKIIQLPENSKYQRHIKRIRERIESAGYRYHDPTGEAFNETRTDIEAEIAGNSVSYLTVEEVIKPVIYKMAEGRNLIIQRAMAIVSGKK